MGDMNAVRDMLDSSPGKPFWGGKGTPVGAKLKGVIIDMDVAQQRNFDSGELMFWEDGKPRMQLVVTVQTTLNDPEIEDDDGQRRLFAKGGKRVGNGPGLSMLDAIKDAQKKANGSKVEVGGILEIEYVGEDKVLQKGMNGMKLWIAKYTPAVVDVEEIDG